MRFPKEPTSNELLELYSKGFEGWIWNKEVARDWGRLMSEQATDTLDDIKDAHKKVKRALLWRSREVYDPGALGKEAQTTGDCVSHGSRTSRDVTRSVEIHIDGEPEEYVARGATEPTYGARGHGGQGMARLPGTGQGSSEGHAWFS